MIARTEEEFNLFNRMDIARREYESRHGVGSGGDGAIERRAWKLPPTTVADDANTSAAVKRKKGNESEDSSDPTLKPKISTSFVIHSDDDTTGEAFLAAGEETSSLPLEDLDDEEDVDFAQEASRIHRRMKTNRLITEEELPDWLKNDVDQVEKTLENDEVLGKGRRQRKDIDYGDNLTEKEFLQALEEGNLDDAVEHKRLRKQNRKSGIALPGDDVDLDETETRSSFDNPSAMQANQQNVSSKRGSVQKRLEATDPKITEQCQLLLDHLLAYRTDDNRQLAQVFIRLPGQKQLPLYYQIIREPIDFQRMRRKIETYRYSSLEQFDADMKLLVDNAQTFNCDTSLIYSDSVQLGKVYQSLREQLQVGSLPPLPEASDAKKKAATPRASSRRERSMPTVDATTTAGVSKRGRKRKALVVIEDDDAPESELVTSNGNDPNTV